MGEGEREDEASEGGLRVAGERDKEQYDARCGLFCNFDRKEALRAPMRVRWPTSVV